MKILVGTNLLTSTNTLTYGPHTQFWFTQGRRRPEDTFYQYAPRRMGIDRMRNEAAKVALELECDYLMFYDDDVIFPKNALDLLLECDADIAAGVTLVRSYPFDPMLFRHNPEHNNQLEFYKDYDKDEGIIDVDAIGFSCALIKVDLLRKLPPPYFVTGPQNTEDVYFCVQARKCFPETTIKANLDLPTMHIMDSYAVSPRNKEAFIEFEKAGDFALQEADKNLDRGKEYIENCLELLRRNAA